MGLVVTLYIFYAFYGLDFLDKIVESAGVIDTYY